MAIRLLIADDHELVREGLRYTFHRTEVKIVAEAASGSAALRMASEHEVDVALIDICMPDCDGFEVLERIKSTQPNLPILIYSMYDRADYIQRSRALGASGYLLKGADAQELVDAVRSVYVGETVWER
jgi:DNA-binding NarL/FixJ family response regulator